MLWSVLRHFQLVWTIHLCVKTNSGLNFQQEFALSTAQMHLFGFFSHCIALYWDWLLGGFCKVWNVVQDCLKSRMQFSAKRCAGNQLQHLMLQCCWECRNMLHSPNCIFPHCKLNLSKLSNVFPKLKSVFVWIAMVQCSAAEVVQMLHTLQIGLLATSFSLLPSTLEICSEKTL